VDSHTRIERTLTQALGRVEGEACPGQLLAATRYAVFPGGARIRPRLCLAVAKACGDDNPPVSSAAAAAIELLHCASLVHDDLPCFDNATLRRGRPAVHVAFGEQLAVLTGDALIVLAFQTVIRMGDLAPRRLKNLLLALTSASGMPGGIVAGQAWECEANIQLSEYQRAKTGALFAAATVAGAAAAGAEASRWHRLGELIGEAYQVADDLRDVASDVETLGKDVGRDAALGRPNAANTLGVAGAVRRLEDLVSSAIAQIPPCAGAAELRAHILGEAARLLPAKLARPMRVVA
jgi:geranylgeranyl diphosphate synthase, type II